MYLLSIIPLLFFIYIGMQKTKLRKENRKRKLQEARENYYKVFGLNR